MNPVRFAVERPYTIAVGVLLTVLFSWLAFQGISVQLKPTVDAPNIAITTIYRGAGPMEVEEQITREIEDLVQGVEGLRKLSSSSSEGVSTVTLEYEWGIDKDRAVIDVINKLSQLPPLPPEAEEPVVTVGSTTGTEIAMWLVVESHYEPNRIRQFVEEEIGPRLERVDGVANLLLVGGSVREIRVLIDPDRLAARGVTFAELTSALQRGHVDLRGGTVETPAMQLTVRTEGRSASLEKIGAIVIRRDAKGTVHVRDVADLSDGFREGGSTVHTSGQPTVAIGIGRETGANVVDMIEEADAVIAELNQRYRERNLDLHLKPVHRDTEYLNQAMDFVKNNLLLGALLAVGVLLIFLRSVRSVIVVGVAIPVSLIAVFLVMQALGRTLNVVSMAGLAFAAGMVVDNAIVVLENIFRHMERGKSSREAVIQGGQEVWGGVLAATLTTVAVFLPIVGIKEEAGQLFADLAIAISAAVALSLVVALMVVPSLTAIFFRGKLEGAAQRIVDHETKIGPIARLYDRAIKHLVGRGRSNMIWKVGLLVWVVAGTIATLRIVPPAGYLPSGNRNLTLFLGQPVPGMRTEALVRSMQPLEEWLLTQPEIERYFLVVAGRFNGGGVVLKPEFATGPGLQAFQQKFLPVTFSVPGFRFLIPIQASLFRDSGKQFTVEITGPDLATLAATAGQIQQQLATWPGVQPNGVSSDYIEGLPELRVNVDAHRAAEASMSVAQVGQVVETAVAGRRVGSWSDGGRDYDLVVVVPQERIRSEAELASLPLITDQGKRTTLGALATVTRTSGPQSVLRLERERAITLTVNLKPDAVLQEVMEAVRQDVVLPAMSALPSDFRIGLGGSADKFSRTLKELLSSFWLAILITYLLLVALFRSWLSPIVILVTVPLALSGGMLGVSIASSLSPNASYDLLAMLGFVILAGVVVNNAILIIHQANNLIAEGQERREALRTASLTRLRPILMSVTTSVCGMLPLAIGTGSGSELYQGLAAVVVGGLIVSTVFTLFLVPALLSLGWDVQAMVTRKA
ncbi:MAG: efflux RND transporter permease subunit [Planctomycetes bacterium]|nr:efflux RND transporter permease subunit [Planctomycetota bacterium]